jgi:large subunit ribosomal protein L9
MNTKVILIQDVKDLGEEGDVKEVKRGYARNYLIPKKLAVPFTKGNLKLIEARRAIIEQKKEEKRQAALGLKERLESLSLKIVMPMGENGRLFGSVTNAIIADELQKQGISIEKKKIEIPEHSIKAQGTYKVKVKLYDNQEAVLKVLVNPKEEASKE